MANNHKFNSSLPNGCNTRVGGQGELALWWAETKEIVCASFFPLFSFVIFVLRSRVSIFDFRFLLLIFNFLFLFLFLLLFINLVYSGSCAD